jgi:hypothetical protein
MPAAEKQLMQQWSGLSYMLIHQDTNSNLTMLAAEILFSARYVDPSVAQQALDFRRLFRNDTTPEKHHAAKPDGVSQTPTDK